ncbi:MAG: ATP-grasp domain-containing protein [Gemmataceae bacterium]|nr:ATP-grasp domain-containing protein [Gemmataceae bacterium]
MPRVLILYNEPTLPNDHPDCDSEHEVIYTASEVEKWLIAGGHTTHKLGVNIDPGQLIAGVRDWKPDVVFNLFEGVPALSLTEAFAAGILEWLGVPYTGCAFQSLVICRDKPLAKRILRGSGVPTPEFLVIESETPPPWPGPWPVIVKPAYQDASVGISQKSVVTSPDEYEKQVAAVIAEFGLPVLAEQYVVGREINVAVCETPELTPLPPFEYVCDKRDGWAILTYDAKWKPGSYDFENTPLNYEPEFPPGVEERLHELAAKAFRLLGCRDLARVDFRVAPDGQPYILEVNPNPDFSPIGGLADCFTNAELTHQEVANQMVVNALVRGAIKLEPPPPIDVAAWT